jgi:hypothetical protein
MRPHSLPQPGHSPSPSPIGRVAQINPRLLLPFVGSDSFKERNEQEFSRDSLS